MFNSNEKYTNRYHDQYRFEKVSPTTYKFVMEGTSMEYCRCGGKEGEETIDLNDLGMFDPSGGPYICLGTKVDNKPIVKIASTDAGYVVEVG
jgi:hypothetical protein